MVVTASLLPSVRQIRIRPVLRLMLRTQPRSESYSFLARPLLITLRLASPRFLGLTLSI